MMRRRYRAREIPFSFDSFLDIVANVVGIIIRLILVVWVGARSYSSVVKDIVPAAPAAMTNPADPKDPLTSELALRRLKLAEAQERLLAQLRQVQDDEQTESITRARLSTLKARCEELTRQEKDLTQEDEKEKHSIQLAALSAEELQTGSQKLTDEIKAIEQTPLPQKSLRFRTPVSRPLHSEELHFECNEGRVSFIDIGSFLANARQTIADKERLLRSQWEYSDATQIIGAFRLRYTFERERGILDTFGKSLPPDSNGTFRYSLSSWQIEPVALERGEPFARALADGSDFRQVVDGIDSRQTAVTFWVYPDSFDLFRHLRDFLYSRDVVVAGRPLPRGMAIASSRRGTVSRGQ